MSLTYDRILLNMGEQKSGHCRAVTKQNIQNIIQLSLDIAAAKIDYALTIKAKSLEIKK